MNSPQTGTDEEDGVVLLSPLLGGNRRSPSRPNSNPSSPAPHHYGTVTGGDAQSAMESGQYIRAGAVSPNSPAQPPPPPPPPTQSATYTAISNVRRSPNNSRPSSRAPSPSFSETSEDLPTNVCTEEQLKLLPAECLSGDPTKPLRHVDEMGGELHYALRPMLYSVIFILLIELLERFAFYGINYTQTLYLTGAYPGDWNAGMQSVAASSYVSISVAVAFSTPFVGAILADSLLGDYWSILFGALVFYLPGLFLIAFTTIPGFLGKHFNQGALAIGLLFLWPLGTGIVKSIINVFGAKQFHPLIQSSLIEAYYVKFYMCINIGALVGGIMVPLLAQKNVTQAYFLPVLMLSSGVLLFVAGSSRYVRTKPKGNLFSKKKEASFSYTGKPEEISLFVIFRISCLVVPFNIAYAQMATTFIVQGTVMHKAFGFIDAASMNNADAVSVLFFGYLVGSKIYPWLSARGIKIPTTYKFALGSALGALAIAWALMVEVLIHTTYEATGKKVNIMWQAMAYILVGAGEIFAVSAAYEVAFTASPPEKKVLSSAINLFCIGGLPNFICIILYNACRNWFRNSNGTTSLTKLEDYATAHVSRYFWVLFLISIGGVLVNLLPCVRYFVESIEEKATDMIKSPKTPSRPPRRGRDAESSPLLRIRRHQAYLKYGGGPTLYKQNSMRAGPTMAKRSKSPKHFKRSTIAKLYRTDPSMPGVNTLISSKGGKPIMAGALLKPPKERGVSPKLVKEIPSLHRSLSND